MLFKVIYYLHESRDLSVSGFSRYWPMLTVVTEIILRNWPVMVTRVPPAMGPYNGRTLSTDISLNDTASKYKPVVYSVIIQYYNPKRHIFLWLHVFWAVAR